MNRNALLSLLITLVIPVSFYLVTQKMSKGAVIMPRRYFPDSIVNTEKDGKTISDTFWHKMANIRLVNQLGDTVSLYDIKKPIVIDLFFTHCNSICPQLTKNMAKLQGAFIKGGESRQKIDTSVVQFISLSIDPENDSVAALKAYADNFGVNPDNWWLLTGNRDSIYNFIFEELKIDKLSNDPISPDFAHTSRFALLDKKYVMRGRPSMPYDGLDSTSLAGLARDIGLLMIEKDKDVPNTVFKQIIDLSWLWLLIVVLVTGFVWFMTNRRKKDEQKNKV